MAENLLGLALGGLVDLLAPPRCAACDLELERGSALVAQGGRMTGRAEPVRAGFCDACAPLLERAPSALGPGVRYAYGGPLADAIRRLKYGARSEIAGPLGALLAEAAPELAGRIDLVAPVPLHGARLAQRGFDQAVLLARPLARRLGVPCAPSALRRVRATAVQASLPRAARAANVRAAFEAGAGVEGRRILVVDDVRTTGATIAEACGALLRAGARSVRPLALAGVEPGEGGG